MKKIYLLTFSLFTLSQLNAQTSYTLTQSNSEPIIGDWYGSVALDTNGVALPMSISGANATWSVTGVTGNPAISNTYSTAASNANSPAFPGTTLVQTDSTITSYYKSSPGALELLGVDGGNFLLNYDTASATIATYPMAFGYSNVDNTVAGEISAGSYSGNFTGSLTTTADATGILDINNSASHFINCIRIKTIQHLDLSFFGGLATGTIDQTLYNYYHSSAKFPIFSASYSHILLPAASIDQTQAQVNTLSSVVIGVKENKLNDVIFKAYPNPTSNNVSLHFVLAQTESYHVEIYNALGEVVKTAAYTNLQPGMYNETINTADLSSGIYTIKVSGKNTQGTEKLIIQK